MGKPWNEMTDDEQNDLGRQTAIAEAVAVGGRPSNAREAECWDLLASNGIPTRKPGWPDFLCCGFGQNEESTIFAVEVKRHPEDLPRPEQLECMQILELAGVPCFVWDRHTGFKRAGSRCFSGMGKQPWDKDCPDPSLIRCGLCYGGGKEFATDAPPIPCRRCKGTGLAAPALAVVP